MVNKSSIAIFHLSLSLSLDIVCNTYLGQEAYVHNNYITLVFEGCNSN